MIESIGHPQLTIEEQIEKLCFEGFAGKKIVLKNEQINKIKHIIEYNPNSIKNLASLIIAAKHGELTEEVIGFFKSEVNSVINL